MLFAVTDIETTGSFAAANGITEIAVYITDGERVLEEFQSLVNPGYPIPPFVQKLTGISEDMVAAAPSFEQVAPELFRILQNKIFVAHNVNFDYSFLKEHFSQAGYQLNAKKLCTIRYARKVLPGLSGYGLDKICRQLKIVNGARHRAAGDARATVELLNILLEKDRKGEIQKMLKGHNREQYLPPNLDAEQLSRLPLTPGIYFFRDKKGKVIYVGKAVNIQKRVKSHFANNSASGKKQEFLRQIYSVDFEECGNETAALIRESVEIMRFFPEQNVSLKRFAPSYGLYAFEDGNGYKRLFIDKIKRNVLPHMTFFILSEGYQTLRKMIRNHRLCPSLCFLQKGVCKDAEICGGGCRKETNAMDYNQRVEAALCDAGENLESFIYLDKGLHYGNTCCIVVEKGRFYGMGFLDSTLAYTTFHDFKNAVSPLADSEYARAVIHKFAQKHPEKVRRFDAAFQETDKAEMVVGNADYLG